MAKVCCTFAMIVRVKRFYATGGASKASDKCSFAKISGNNKVWCNGRGKQGKDALSVCAQGLCKDAKPTKHTQTLTLRKASGDSKEKFNPCVCYIDNLRFKCYD